MEFKIMLVHPTGNANVRATAEGFLKIGILDSFYTCIAIYSNSLIYKFFRWGLLREFRRRSFNPNLKSYTRIRPVRELGRLASQKFGFKKYIQHEVGIFSVDTVYKDLDRFVSKRINGTSAIYAYEDGALESFRIAKSKGVKCFYELPTGYWRAHQKFLGDEGPDWSQTLNCFRNSPEKLARKDKELAMADAIIVASDFVKRTLELYPGQLAPIHVIPYGFPEVFWDRPFSPIKDRKLKILFIGGLSQLKGVSNILEAFEALDERVQLTLVGRKPVDACLPLQRGLKKHTWIPSLPHEDVLKLMREHDVFLFPSFFEGYGLVITESMAQGTPVITTRRTCGANFIKDGVNGWLIEPGNTHSIIQKINDILENADSIPAMGKAAMKTAEKLPMKTFGKRVAEVIKEYVQ